MSINFTITSGSSFHNHIVKAKKNIKKQIDVFIVTTISLILLILEIQHNKILIQQKKTVIYNIVKIKTTSYFIRNFYTNLVQIIKQNQSLIIEKNNLIIHNIELAQEIESLKILKKENQDLKNLLFSEEEVIAKKSYIKLKGIIWDAAGPLLIGTSSIPACLNCLVVVKSGLLGKVDYINKNQIIIMPISNKNFRIPIITEKKEEKAIVVGGNVPELAYLEDYSQIEEGEKIITVGDNDHSVIDGIYVGKVMIKNNKYFITSTAEYKQHKIALLLSPIENNNE